MRSTALLTAALIGLTGCSPSSTRHQAIGWASFGGAATLGGTYLLTRQMAPPDGSDGGDGLGEGALRCDAGCILPAVLVVAGLFGMGIGLSLNDEANAREAQDGPTPTGNPAAWDVPAPVDGLDTEPGLPALPTDEPTRRLARAAHRASTAGHCVVVRANLRAIARRDRVYHAALVDTDWARACR